MFKEEAIEEENDLMYVEEPESQEDEEKKEIFDKIIIGVCAMAKKVNSKPMEAILTSESLDRISIKKLLGN